MLSADQITALQDSAQAFVEPIVEWLISDIAERISTAGQFTSTASYEIWRAQNLGLSLEDIKRQLQKKLHVTASELEQLLRQAAEVGYNFDLSRLPTANAIPFAENTSLQQIVDAAVRMVGEDLTNLTKTAGFVCPDGKPRPLYDAYRNACDFAFQKTVTGAQDYIGAVRDATRGLAEKGVISIEYNNGKRYTLEAAVRRSVVGGMGLIVEEVNRQNFDALGCDGWEISAHSASAPDHEPIQGKQYPDAEYQRLNNSLVRRIGTLNCGHDAFPIILGVNSPQYTPAELEEMRQENEKGVTYGGKHYTLYEATQVQRKLERSIRRQKHRILVDEALQDTDKLQTDQIKYQMLTQEYKRFSKATGQRMQYERMEVAGFGPKQANAAEITVRSTEEDVFKNKKMDLKKMSEKVEAELEKHCNRPSKWSGRTVIKPRDAMIGSAGKKDWSCDIILREDAGVKTVIHEHLHGRSVSYYDRETYIRFQRAEEGTVELFAQEICKKNEVSFRKAYPETVKRLQIINSIAKIGDGYTFAQQLFDIPLVERYNWLKEKANSAIAEGNLSDKSIQVLKDAVEYMRGKGVK